MCSYARADASPSAASGPGVTGGYDVGFGVVELGVGDGVGDVEGLATGVVGPWVGDSEPVGGAPVHATRKNTARHPTSLRLAHYRP